MPLLPDWTSKGKSGRLLARAVIRAMMKQGGISLTVFEKIGLSFLRRAWWNLDLLWGTALLLAAGTFVLFP